MNTELMIAELMQIIEKPEMRISHVEDTTRPVTKLPVVQTLTPGQCNRIMKLRADLFYNQYAKQGTPKYDLKLFVWFDHKDGKSGHIKPLHFWLYQADRLDPTGESLLARLVQACEPEWLAGCLTHKINGTKKHKDHVAVRVNDTLMIRVGDQDEDFVVWTFDSFEELKVSEKGNSPIARWYWNRPD
jgi:hypothetical protein